MNRLSQEKINEIKNSVNIVDIISNYVSLEPKGKNFFGICPFHDDNNPSMSVSPDKKIYKCFSCGATGNVFKFLMDYENISFLEAVKQIADYSGMNIDIKTKKQEKNNNNLYNIYNLSLKYYTNNINTKAATEAKKYLKKRNIDEKTIKEFQIGLALNDNLFKILIKKFKEEDVLKSGLINKNEYGYLDTFKERIMFPLYNLNGQVIGYSGRIYNKTDNSKYINTKETEIFKKGEILYNYHRSKVSARQKNQIIVMEGFMDVIRAYTIGITNTVATMGTAVTKNQAQIIKKMAKEIILCFDGDKAGEKATKACADELISIGVTPKIIRLDDNLDPDEFIKKYGKDAFVNKINNPISFMDFNLSYLKKDKNLKNSVDKAEYIKEILNEINKINDDILKEITIKKITEEINIDEEFIRKKLKSTKKSKIKPKSEKKTKISKYEIAQRNLLYYMLEHSEIVKMYDNKVTYMPKEEYRLLAREISMFYKENGFINISDLIDYTEGDQEISQTIQNIEKANLKENYSLKEIEDYIETIKEYNIKTECKRLKKQMNEEIDPIKKASIAQKIIDLKKESNNV